MTLIYRWLQIKIILYEIGSKIDIIELLYLFFETLPITKDTQHAVI